MRLEETLACAKEAGAFKENRPLIGREYWVFPCEEDLQAFAALITAADRQAVLDTVDALTGMEQERNHMFSEGYDHALRHIEEFVRGRNGV
jgi:hypothetical protein